MKELTTRNSALSTRWLPSVSNMLKAILNPDWGSRSGNKNVISYYRKVHKQLDRTCQYTQEEQILSVANDSLVTKWSEE